MSKAKDLTGTKFGRLTVIERRGSDKSGIAMWLCRCECGNEVVVRGSSLRRGGTTSCGCYNREKASEKAKDITGMKFGRLTVIERRGSNKRGNAMWLCKCECGNEVVVRTDILKSGATTSCGCYHKEKLGEKAKDITGMKFGRLTVIERRGSDKHGNALWLCKCDCGNEVVVYGGHLRRGITMSCGCYQKDKAREIVGEGHPNWKGGITLISDHLRNLPIVTQWRKDTYIRENNRCQLTGKKVHGGNSDVHHLKAFSTIVLEAHELHNIQVKPQVKDYTEEELHKLEEYIESWHKNTLNAVLLSEDVHNLFHSLYKYGDNTQEQFEEFKERYMKGEFEEVLNKD